MLYKKGKGREREGFGQNRTEPLDETYSSVSMKQVSHKETPSQTHLTVLCGHVIACFMEQNTIH